MHTTSRLLDMTVAKNPSKSNVCTASDSLVVIFEALSQSWKKYCYRYSLCLLSKVICLHEEMFNACCNE